MPAATDMPTVPFNGRAMPIPPPTTHAICSAVSDRANADVRTTSGTSDAE